jgi:hypothetical protein
MADLHHHHGDSSTTIVREDMDREGPATALIVLLSLAFVGFLIWLFAFSGIIFHTNSGGGSTTTNNNVRIQQPATQPSSNTGGSTGGTNSSPMPS